jgi:hypothetical protein
MAWYMPGQLRPASSQSSSVHAPPCFSSQRPKFSSKTGTLWSQRGGVSEIEASQVLGCLLPTRGTSYWGHPLGESNDWSLLERKGMVLVST